MGKPDGKHETKNGTYYVLEKFPDIVMDSSTYGVPVDSKEGYELKVKDAVRIDNSGVFVHSAPWSVAQQGRSNVSHGCINLSAENAKWFYDNFGSGDPVVIKNTGGVVQHARRRVRLADVASRTSDTENPQLAAGFSASGLDQVQRLPEPVKVDLVGEPTKVGWITDVDV